MPKRKTARLTYIVYGGQEVKLVKVLWSRHGVEEATWETEQDMINRYPELFGM